MIRFGLCCQFAEVPVRFGSTTAASLSRLSRDEALRKVSRLCLGNACALQEALEYCGNNKIGCFRVLTPILPCKTHPTCGYSTEELPNGSEVQSLFKKAGKIAKAYGLRTTFHPDQFIVLNSPRPEVVHASVREIEYQAEVAEWIGADVITIHAGGIYGNKSKALDDLRRGIDRLSGKARKRLALENDDKSYTPSDLLPFCQREAIPFVYDVHHHRCLPDGLSVSEATHAAMDTWNTREPLFHISSPLGGWKSPQPFRHHDFVDPEDFPSEWTGKNITVEVEAKRKEIAVLRLMCQVREREECRS